MENERIYQELNRIYLDYILPLQGHNQMKDVSGFSLSVSLMDDVADLLYKLRLPPETE